MYGPSKSMPSKASIVFLTVKGFPLSIFPASISFHKSGNKNFLYSMSVPNGLLGLGISFTKGFVPIISIRDKGDLPGEDSG